MRKQERSLLSHIYSINEMRQTQHSHSGGNDELVIRPSGVWNSRSPLTDYVKRQRQLSRTVASLQLADIYLRKAIDAEADQATSGKRFLTGIAGHKDPGKDAWMNYRRSWGYDVAGRAPYPSIASLSADSESAIHFVEDMAIIRLSSTFEAFCQCWSLNVLLSILEDGQRLRPAEAALNNAFRPILTGKRSPVLPDWWDIIDAFPQLRIDLNNLPHLFTDPATGQKVSKPISATLNAFVVISFWREYRNLSVHTSRQITTHFHRKWADPFSEMMHCFGHVEELKVGQPLPIHDDLYGAMAACHYRAALTMTKTLETLSFGRRGHPEAPSTKTTEVFFPDLPPSPALLLAGDHQPSVRWLRDNAYRKVLATERGWNLLSS